MKLTDKRLLLGLKQYKGIRNPEMPEYTTIKLDKNNELFVDFNCSFVSKFYVDLHSLEINTWYVED